MNNGNGVLTFLVIGGVLVVAYVIYKQYNPTASKTNNTILTDVSAGTSILSSLSNSLGALSNLGGGSSDNTDGFSLPDTSDDSEGLTDV